MTYEVKNRVSKTDMYHLQFSFPSGSLKKAQHHLMETSPRGIYTPCPQSKTDADKNE